MVNTVEALIILALFVLPGFLLSEMARRGRAPAAEESALRLLLRSLVFALVIQACAAAWTDSLAEKTGNFTVIGGDVSEVAAYVLVVLVGVPLLLGLLLARNLARAEARAIETRTGLSLLAAALGAKEATHAWDRALLGAKDGAFPILTLKDGRTIAGRLGLGFFATEAAIENADLLLDRIWLVGDDGEPIAPLESEGGSWEGIWVPRSEIASFWVYRPHGEPPGTG